MFLKGNIIFIILISELVSGMEWTWEEVKANYFLLQGRAVSGRAAAVHRCSAFCMDAHGCWGSGCHYDLSTLHCYESVGKASSDRVQYHGYNPVWRSESECVNIGGGAVTGQFGYQFDADPQTSVLLNFFRLSTSAGIAGAGADQPIYQTARTASKFNVEYYLKFVGDRYFLCRFMFAEIGGKRRNFNMVLNNAYTLKSGFDVAGTTGYNSAYATYITVKGQNGNTQIVLNGQATGLQPGGLALLSIRKNGFLSTGIINGFCGTRFPPCTEHCNNPGTCNSRSECYYDYKISHCVQASFRPPPPPPPPGPVPTPAPPTPPPTTPAPPRPTTPDPDDACARIGADRNACEANKCIFCCNTLTCRRKTGTKRDPNCYNGGCIGDCFREDACHSRPNHCMYEEDTGRCIDCTYVKLQLAFVVDASSELVIKNFQQQSNLTRSLKRIFRDPEFAVTSFADWERSAWDNAQSSHSDPDGCYKIVQKFTTDEREISNAAQNMQHMPSGGLENGDTALTWTSADNALGWRREQMISDGRQVVRVLLLLENQNVHGQTLWNPGSRVPPTGDGTDSCRKNIGVTGTTLLKDVLTRDMMSVIAVFSVDENTNVISQWDNIFAGSDILYSSFDSSVPDDDLTSYIRAFVAGQNMNDMCATRW